MIDHSLRAALAAFVKEKRFRGKGSLSVALVITQHARNMGLPLDPEKLFTDSGGQVLGLGRGAVQAILAKHGVSRVLAKEGGRTSRGSVGNMRSYVAFLNDLHSRGPFDFDQVELFWVERVHEFFAAKPFKIKLDGASSLKAVVDDLIRQAEDRQQATPGVQHLGAVMQHLVGAKLDCVLGRGKFDHNSFSTADAPSNRAGDFLVGDVAIHVTSAPTEALIQKCRDNLESGLRPLIVTLDQKVEMAFGLAENDGFDKRIDAFGIAQFLAANLYELGSFAAEGRRTAINDLVERYNQVVNEFETDPSLMIEAKR